MKTINADQWNKETKEEALLLDVRSPGEFAGLRAEGAVNLPLDKVTPEGVKKLSDGRKIVYLCQGGTRAKMAAEKCQSLENDQVVFEGGTQSWKEAGLPIIESKGGVISLERQVRIGAGALVVAGLVASQFLGIDGAEYLSLFVGAGLIFAGVTDTCAMGLILAKMPWNQKSGSCCGG